jgi:septal ring-binding cell division protein DamX
MTTRRAAAHGPSEPDDAPDDRKSAWHNPWLWATVGVAVVAIALGVWGLNERSNADDAKADLQAQEKKPASSTTATETQTETQQQTSTQEAQTSADRGGRRGARPRRCAGGGRGRVRRRPQAAE